MPVPGGPPAVQRKCAGGEAGVLAKHMARQKPIDPRRGFIRSRRGATAIEFALLAPLFFAVIFAIFEAGYFFFISSAVDQAAAKAARLIRTGQVQSASNPVSREAFFDEICNVVRHFGDCGERLTVDVSRFNTFSGLAADLSTPTCRDADEEAVDALPYETGGERDIVRVRVCYLHKTLSPGLGLDLSKAPDGSRKVISVAIFRNEPFES